MPAHGDVRYRSTNVYERERDLWFWAANGEGFCFVPKREELDYETRYCAGCGFWVGIEGELELLQADYVGCLRCGTPWPRKVTES